MSEKGILLHKSKIPLAVVELVDELLEAKEASARQVACRNILGILTSHFNVCNCRIRVYDEERPQTEEGKSLFGQYLNRPREKPLIEIWNYTRTGRRVSSVSIFYTLLHEFIHHYDARYLGVDPRHGFDFDGRLRFLIHIFKQQKDLRSKRINK